MSQGHQIPLVAMPTEPTRFPLLGEPLALDLVNTVVRFDGRDHDLLADERQLRAWFDAQGTRLPSAEPTRTVLGSVHAIRRAVRRCLDAALDDEAPPADDISALNRAAAAAPAGVAIELDPSGRRRRVARRSGPAADQVGAALAEAAIELLTEYDLRRVRTCASEDCVLLFHANHPKRRWCSPDGCGNRERVRRHYRRHRR